MQGKRNDKVASEIGVRPNTVGQWRRRFAASGMAGLRDAPRPGKRAKYGVELGDRILAQLELPPPAGMASWDGGSLALALSVSDDAVWRVLRREGIQLQRHRSCCVSTDPECAAKVADVIGPYLNAKHIAREESELLPMAARLLSEAELDRVGLAMRARRGFVSADVLTRAADVNPLNARLSLAQPARKCPIQLAEVAPPAGLSTSLILKDDHVTAPSVS